jgi:hypothetical protein
MQRGEDRAVKPFRFRLSVRTMMLTIASIGCGLAFIPGIIQHFDGTLYSKGYRESRFLQVRVGMASAEVEALMGPPLDRQGC